MKIRWNNLLALCGCVVVLLLLTRYRLALQQSCDALMLPFGEDGEGLCRLLIIVSIVVLVLAITKLFFGQKSK